MKKENLIQHLVLFKGENECPYTNGSVEAEIWSAEEFCADHPAMIDDSDPDGSIIDTVASFIGKWDPFDWRDVVEHYIQLKNEK